jgi:hypothetical protein
MKNIYRNADKTKSIWTEGFTALKVKKLRVKDDSEALSRGRCFVVLVGPESKELFKQIEAAGFTKAGSAHYSMWNTRTGELRSKV